MSYIKPCHYGDTSGDGGSSGKTGGCMRTLVVWIAAALLLLLLCGLASCSSVKESSSSIDRHRFESLVEHMDSVMSLHREVRQDSSWHEIVMRQFLSIREKNDTSRTVIVDTAGKVVRETLVINNVREASSETDRREREMMMKRLETMDSTLSVVRSQLQRTDSLLQSQKEVIEKPVEKRLSWWQQTRLHLANIMLWLLFFYVSVRVYGFWRQRGFPLNLLNKLKRK